MSINENLQELSINEFALEITEKTKLFFKSFNELTKENFDTFLECIDLLDIWNTKEEKEFLWNSFYKYNIKGKVLESSVIKGLNEILSKDDNTNSIISLEAKDEDYLSDNFNIIRLSYKKKRTSALNKVSINSFSELNFYNEIYKTEINNLNKFIEERDIKELKQLKNIMIIINNDNNMNNSLIKESKIIEIFEKYPCLKIPTTHIINYLSCISEKISLDNKNKNKLNNEGFNINNDLLKISTKLIDDKIKNYEKESIIDEDSNFDLNTNSSSFIDDNKNILEKKLKKIFDLIINNDEELKQNISIFKEIENSLKKSNQDIINNFKILLSIKNESKNNENLNKIIDNNNNDDEENIKMNIENNIFYIQKKSNLLDLFIQETEKILNQKEIKNNNLEILINKLIQNIINLEEEKNVLFLKNKETEQYTDKQLNNIDDKINNLLKEKKLLENKVNELIEQIEKNKKINKDNQLMIKELDEMHNIKVKELEEKEKENNLLKQENKKYKDDYELLLNQTITMKNNKEKELKEYENKILLNAKNNIEKKMYLNESQKKLCLLNHEQLLEYCFDSIQKNDIKEKNVEETNQLLKDKNRRINQLESDLELYREKTNELSKENKALKQNNKDNKIFLQKNKFTLAELGISRSNFSLNENNNNKNKNSSNEFKLFDSSKETLRTLRSSENNNLFAPPCFSNTDRKTLYSNNKDKEQNEIKFMNNPYALTNENKLEENFTNDGNNGNNEKLKNNEIKKDKNEDISTEKNKKYFYNTPNGNNNERNNSLVDIFKNIINNESQNNIYNSNNRGSNPYNNINERPSNPYRSDNKMVSNPYNNIGNNSSNPYDNNSRESNQYKYNTRESNSYNENYIENNPYKDYKEKDEKNLNKNENLNINKEILKNNESNNKLINDKEIIISSNLQSDDILKENNLPIHLDKSLSIEEMDNIFKKNHENKLSITSFDYLHLFNNDKIRDILIKIGDYCSQNEIFSDIVYLLDEYEQLYKYILFITKKCIYLIETITYKIKFTFVRNILIRFTISNNNYNIIVFHFNVGNDLVIMTLRRPELIYYFLKIKNNNKEESNIKFKYADEFNIKKDGRYYTQNIKSSMKSISFNFQTALKLGYLIKINEGYIFNQYHEKLVVLTDFGLIYFDNPTASPKKLIPIIGSEITPSKSKLNDIQYIFEIRTLNKNKIVFGTNDKEDYDEWIKIFNDVKLKHWKKKVEV